MKLANRKRGSGVGFRLLLQFGAVSLIPVVAIGVVVGRQLRASTERRALATFAASSGSAAQVISQTYLDRPGGGTDAVSAAGDAVTPVMSSLISLTDPASSIRVVNLLGRVQYASNKTEVGRKAPPNPDRIAVFAGESRAHWLSNDDLPRATPGKRYFAMSFPLTVRGVPMASVEVVAADQSIAKSISADIATMQMWLGFGMAMLWLSLCPIVWRIARRISRQAEENELLAFHDPLTELPNRSYLLRRGGEAIASNKRTGILLIDLDNFKDVNDTLGHDSGDLLLIHVAKVLRSLTRGEDVVARLGGDEFAVLIPGIPDEIELAAAADRIKAALELSTPIDGILVSARSSIGLALTPDHGTTIGELFQRADTAMYASKERSVPVTYSSDIDPHSIGRLAMTADLRTALSSSNEIYVAFQPIVDAQTGEIVSAEVLGRWNSATRGAVSPFEFIGLAEHTGLIRALTERVVEMTACQLEAWRAEGVRLPVSINLSARNLSEPDLPERLLAAFRKHGIEPAEITLEVTETGLIHETADVFDSVNRLRSFGFHLSLDDFGTGYSSLTYLRTLQADVLKIDRSFVQQIGENPGDAQIVSAVIAMAHGLNMVVVAEGVETHEQWDLLRRLGCDRLQGYLFSRPVSAAEVASRRHAPLALPASLSSAAP